MLPYSVAIWGFATPVYASPPTVDLTGGLVAIPALPSVSGQAHADAIRTLPDEVMRSVLGGPEGQETPLDLESPEVVLASFSSSTAGTLASQLIPTSVPDSCTGLMDTLMAEVASGDV